MSFKFSPVPRFKIIGFPMKSICCVPSLRSVMKCGGHSPVSLPSSPLFISHRVKIITEPFRERFPASGPPISLAVLAPQALPLFLQGPQFDLWENSWQIGMSILMDDIICTILLIMYDYLFVCLFSLVAIDLQLQQLKGGGSGNLVPAERPPSGKISGLLFPGKPPPVVRFKSFMMLLHVPPQAVSGKTTPARLSRFPFLEERKSELRVWLLGPKSHS